MQVAWDDSGFYWPGRLIADPEGGWSLLTGRLPELGRLLTITPIKGSKGPNFEFFFRVVALGEDVLVSAFSDERFQVRLVAVDLDVESERGLVRALRAA